MKNKTIMSCIAVLAILIFCFSYFSSHKYAYSSGYSDSNVVPEIKKSSLSESQAGSWIELNGIKSEIVVPDSDSLDISDTGTWNLWVKQHNYIKDAGLIGKYSPRTGLRSYLIKTILNNGTGIILSGDGENAESYSTISDRACGIRNNEEWTMLTVTYNGSLINYYRNGIKCDSDFANINKIFNSNEKIRLGGGNDIFFNGSIDDIKIYNISLPERQVQRLYDESEHGGNLGTSVTIVLYHQIVGSKEEADLSDKISMEDFEMQMKYLHDAGFQSITTEHFNNMQKNSLPIPEKNVLIFFDDGWESVYGKAYPIMEKYGFVGTIAAVSDYVNSNSANRMTWKQLQELQDKGWRIEAHGKNHIDMTQLSESEFRNQMEISKNEIIKNLVKTPESFVFPLNKVNEKYIKICGEYFDLCWGKGESPAFPYYIYGSTDGHEFNALRRLTIVNNTDFESFKSVFSRHTGIVAEWHLDLEDINAKDYSKFNNNGKLINGAYFSTYQKIVPKQAFASSVYSSSYTAKNSIDGNANSIWISNSSLSYPQWIYFDLGDSSYINSIDLYVYPYYLPETIDIQVSDDAQTWKTIASGWKIERKIYGRYERKTFNEIKAKYLRFYITSGPMPFASISEVKINAEPSVLDQSKISAPSPPPIESPSVSEIPSPGGSAEAESPPTPLQQQEKIYLTSKNKVSSNKIYLN